MSRGDTRPSLCVAVGRRVLALLLSRWQLRMYGSVSFLSGRVQSVRVLSGLRLSWITAAAHGAFRAAS